MLNEVTSYWNQRPCNSRHSQVDIAADPLRYSQEVTDRKLAVEPHLLPFMAPWHWYGKRVLDLGCGIGTVAILYAHRGASVLGLDISRRSIEIAITRGMAEDLQGRLMFGVWNMEDRPQYLDQEAFDLVWAWGSVHHTPHPEVAMQRIAQYLKPGGELRLMVYHRLSTKALRLWVRAGFPKDFDAAVARGSEAEPGCPITHTYTRRTARRLVEGAGLAVKVMRVDHIFAWEGEAYGRGEFIKARPWRWMPRRMFRRLERLMGWHLMVVARREA